MAGKTYTTLTDRVVLNPGTKNERRLAKGDDVTDAQLTACGAKPELLVKSGAIKEKAGKAAASS